MSALYLITGFLGSGKTTFLKNFIRMFPGQRIELIVNEFGKEGVDGALLSDLEAYLKEISGGSVFCSCRLDQFEEALFQSQTRNPDAILVEASGLSDPSGVRRMFSQANRFPYIQYGGAVCLVDAVRFPKLYATARACARQLAASDVALVNKTDLASGTELSQTLALLRGQRPDIPVLKTSFGQIPPGFPELLSSAGNSEEKDSVLVEDLSIQRITLTFSETIRTRELEMFLRMFAEQSFRIKGFLSTQDQKNVLVDCVGTILSITPFPNPVPPEKLGFLTILSGTKMPIRSAISRACQWYPQYIRSVHY